MKTRFAVMFCVVLFGALGCVHSMEKEIEVHPRPEDDKDYFNVYNAATAHHEVISNFETKFIVQSTLLSSAFRQAFAKRYQVLYSEKEPVLTEASTRTGFFVSLYTADRELGDMRDVNLWSIQLRKGEDSLKPIKVEKLREKERWRPFFKGISPWSHEFLVIFDSPASASGNQDLVQSKETKLVLSSQDGRVTMTF